MTVTEGINIKFNLLGFVIPTERFKSFILTFLYNPTGGAVREAKEHDLWFEESTVCVEGGFPFISIADPYVVETPADIQFGEVSHAMELCDQFRDEWNWVLVLDCDHIQGSVVLYEPE